jgi:hypothetical protein
MSKYEEGKAIGQQMLIAAAHGNWARVVDLENHVDVEDDDMCDGYNDGISETVWNNLEGVTSETVEAMIQYIDEHKKKGAN